MSKTATHGNRCRQLPPINNPPYPPLFLVHQPNQRLGDPWGRYGIIGVGEKEWGVHRLRSHSTKLFRAPYPLGTGDSAPLFSRRHPILYGTSARIPAPVPAPAPAPDDTLENHSGYESTYHYIIIISLQNGAFPLKAALVLARVLFLAKHNHMFNVCTQDSYYEQSGAATV